MRELLAEAPVLVGQTFVLLQQSLEIVLRLLRSDEPVSYEGEWFTLRDARLHLTPYTLPHPEVAVAAMISPSGPRAAGRFGC